MQEFFVTYLGLSLEVQGKIFESIFVILIFLVLQKLIKKFAISKIQDIKGQISVAKDITIHHCSYNSFFSRKHMAANFWFSWNISRIDFGRYCNSFERSSCKYGCLGFHSYTAAI